MPVFGSSSVFGIEASVHNAISPGIWGGFCVWVQGRRIGDPEVVSSLHGVTQALKALESGMGNLWRPEFSGLDVRSLWNLLDEAVYSYHGDIEVDSSHRSLEDLRRDHQTYGRFVFLTNTVESFDGNGKCFIVCPSESEVQLLHWDRKEPSGNPRCFKIPSSSVRESIRDFLAWIDQQG